MEEIAVKSKGFSKLIPIYVGVGVVAVLASAVLLLLKYFEIWVWIILAMGGSGFLAALLLLFLDRKLPSCYIAREGNKLKFENGFECNLSEVSNVFCKKSSLYIVVGEREICYQFVSQPEVACQRLLALVEESKKENPNYDKVNA